MKKQLILHISVKSRLGLCATHTARPKCLVDEPQSVEKL